MERETVYHTARRYPRFTAKQRALVLLHDEKDKLHYHIVQIGQGGLSFRYLGQKLNHAEISKVSLYHEDQLIVDSIPVKPVSDYRLRDNFIPIRCGCVCFKELDNRQKQKVDVFIQNYTVAAAKS